VPCFLVYIDAILYRKLDNKCGKKGQISIKETQRLYLFKLLFRPQALLTETSQTSDEFHVKTSAEIQSSIEVLYDRQRHKTVQEIEITDYMVSKDTPQPSINQPLGI